MLIEAQRPQPVRVGARAVKLVLTRAEAKCTLQHGGLEGVRREERQSLSRARGKADHQRQFEGERTSNHGGMRYLRWDELAIIVCVVGAIPIPCVIIEDEAGGVWGKNGTTDSRRGYVLPSRAIR